MVVNDFSPQPPPPDISMATPPGHYRDAEETSPLPERKKKKTIVSGPKTDATAWLQMQHDKLMTRKYGPDYTRRKDKESALLEELRASQERMIDQVPNRELDENRLPLSALLLREAKTPPLVRRPEDDDMDGPRMLWRNLLQDHLDLIHHYTSLLSD